MNRKTYRVYVRILHGQESPWRDTWVCPDRAKRDAATASLGHVTEVGPFSSIEQAALTQTTSEVRCTQVFAWYRLVGAFAMPLGAVDVDRYTHRITRLAHWRDQTHDGWGSNGRIAEPPDVTSRGQGDPSTHLVERWDL